MLNRDLNLSTVIPLVFWVLFAVFVGVHLWIGGVVIDHKYEDGQNYFLLRENKSAWAPVGIFTYLAHVVSKTTMFSFCLCGLSLAAWRWLWHKVP